MRAYCQSALRFKSLTIFRNPFQASNLQRIIKYLRNSYQNVRIPENIIIQTKNLINSSFSNATGKRKSHASKRSKHMPIFLKKAEEKEKECALINMDSILSVSRVELHKPRGYDVWAALDKSWAIFIGYFYFRRLMRSLCLACIWSDITSLLEGMQRIT